MRSLAQAGLRVIVVSADQRDVATVSRHARAFRVPTFDGESFIEELLHLRNNLPNGGVLICADDRPLLSVSRYRERLTPYFHFQLPPHQLLVELSRKDRFYEIARDGGFPVPPTALLRNRNDLGLLGDLRPPLCVKPNFRSQAYDGSFKKAYRIESQSEAHSLCERVIDVAEVIVQEWIEGSNDSIYFSLCCLGEPGPVAFTGRKGRSWPPQIGYTASCWAAPEVAEELEDLTMRFFREAGVTSGLASMEFKQDQRDGRFLMVEPTVGRADRQVEISAFCGINLCHLAYCDAAQRPRPPIHLDPTHVWRDEFTDLAAARILGTPCFYPPGYQIHNAHWRWDDPAPALLVAADYARKALRRMTRWRQ
jgi:predicted ATP-grasp superfamily ATP-dependent carboligase